MKELELGLLTAAWPGLLSVVFPWRSPAHAQQAAGTGFFFQTGYQGKVLHRKGGQTLEQPPQGSGHFSKLTGIQEAFVKCSQTSGLIFG